MAPLPVAPVLHRGPCDDDMAATRELLRHVSQGATRAALRIYEPSPTLAFSRRETHRPGYTAARAAAVKHGFRPVVRNAGGQAVAYGPGSLVVELMAADRSPAMGIHERFELYAHALATAFAQLGVDASVGRIDGEYCPGEHSVVVGDRAKVAGTAQRLVHGAWLCTAAIVVAGAAALRGVLIEVYGAMGYEWRPETLMGLADVAPAVTVDRVDAALRRSFGVGTA